MVITTPGNVDRELREIHEAIILDHYERPRNFGELQGATHTSEAHNPLCGDRFRIFLRIVGDVITEAAFEGYGCAISTASGSVMTTMVAGLSRARAAALAAETTEFLTSGNSTDLDGLGDLQAFDGIYRIPTRRRCALLAWTALREALIPDPC